MTERTFTAVGTRPVRHDGVDKVTGRRSNVVQIGL